jgi:glycosyltransferase involved in cell wall biosynthesis
MHLCAPAHVGGLERVVQGLAVGGTRAGQRVRVVAVVEPDAPVSDFAGPMREAGVPVDVVELPARAYLKEIRAVRRLLSDVRPDVLHTHGYRSDLLHGWAARAGGVATVSTLHGSSRMGGASALFEWIQERALGRFDAVIAVSSPLVGSLVERGVPATRIHAVPNAWTPPSSPLGRAEARTSLEVGGGDDADMDTGTTPIVIGWVGRLIPVKGGDVFLHALAGMRTSGWVARVVGDGPERERLEALADRLGLLDRVRFLGAIPDAARLFAGLDLFALSSRSEGTPMVLLEAMGAGVAVVATRVGGVPAVVTAPELGWLVDSEDPEGLATALDGAVAADSERSRRARAAHERVVRDFSLESWIRRHEAVYRAAIAVRRGTSPPVDPVGGS